MQQEEAVIDIHITDSRTGFAVSRHIRQFVVGSESLAVAGGSDTAGNVEFLAYNVVPNAVDGMYIRCVSCQGCHICHAGIHIGGTHGVSYCFVLFDDRFVCLAVFVTT